MTRHPHEVSAVVHQLVQEHSCTRDSSLVETDQVENEKSKKGYRCSGECERDGPQLCLNIRGMDGDMVLLTG